MTSKKEAAIVAVVIAAVAAGVALYARPKANGDASPDGYKDARGVRMHVDRLTGCHYISTWDGGLYPRLTADGSQLCENRSQ